MFGAPPLRAGADVSTTRLPPSVENERFSSPAPVVVVTTSLLAAHIALETCSVGAPPARPLARRPFIQRSSGGAAAGGQGRPGPRTPHRHCPDRPQSSTGQRSWAS